MTTPGGPGVSKALQELVEKRQQQLAYLRRAHIPDRGDERTYFLNCIQHQKEQINDFANDDKKMRGWFALGLSIGSLLEQEGGPMLANCLSQLIEEFEFEFGGGKMSASVKFLRAKKLSTKEEMGKDEVLKPAIFKQHGRVVFQFLNMIVLPSEVDYCEIVHSLLSCLYILYSQFLTPKLSTEKWRKAVEQTDARIGVLVLKPLTDVLTKLTEKVTENELSALLPSKSIAMAGLAGADGGGLTGASMAFNSMH